MERDQFKRQERNQYYPYEKIIRALDYALKILTSRDYAITYYQYAEWLVDGIVRVIGIDGAFGTGYPFYLLSSELPEIFTVGEYDRFIDETRQKLYNGMGIDIGGGWICPTCQLENQLPDLKTMCNPCENVVFKPRDLFKALPDLDITLVGNPNFLKETLDGIDSYVQDNNLMLSDPNIREAIDQFLSGVEANRPDRYVFLDIHVLNTDEFNRALENVRRGLINFSVPVNSYRGNNRWVSEYLPFWYDFILSITPLGAGYLPWSRELSNVMKEMRDSPTSMLQRLQQECEANKEEKHFARILRLITDGSQPFIINALTYRFFTRLDSE